MDPAQQTWKPQSMATVTSNQHLKSLLLRLSYLALLCWSSDISKTHRNMKTSRDCRVQVTLHSPWAQSFTFHSTCYRKVPLYISGAILLVLAQLVKTVQQFTHNSSPTCDLIGRLTWFNGAAECRSFSSARKDLIANAIYFCQHPNT